ncbi:hypothetical protein ABIF69_005848 [Bradyrhizobium japonicum]
MVTADPVFARSHTCIAMLTLYRAVAFLVDRAMSNPALTVFTETLIPK